MSGLLSSCESLFGTRDLYAVVGVSAENKSCPASALRRAYHKRSLVFHPDRVSPEARAEATKKFQCLGAAYKLLSDADRRALYDESGEVDDEGDADLASDDRDWDQYWRLLFKKISVDDIAAFEQTYRHTEEELNDLKAAYLDGEGSMEYILDNVLCCTDQDQERFTEILREAVLKEELPHFPNFAGLSAKEMKKRKRKADKEAKEADELAEELGLGKDEGEDSLANMIMKRQAARAKEADSFLDGLAAKYAAPPKKGKSKKK